MWPKQNVFGISTFGKSIQQSPPSDEQVVPSSLEHPVLWREACVGQDAKERKKTFSWTIAWWTGMQPPREAICLSWRETINLEWRDTTESTSTKPRLTQKWHHSSSLPVNASRRKDVISIGLLSGMMGTHQTNPNWGTFFQRTRLQFFQNP